MNISNESSIARIRWIRVLLKKGDYILGVQTLRNWIITGTMFASTAILLVVAMVKRSVNQCILKQPTFSTI